MSNRQLLFYWNDETSGDPYINQVVLLAQTSNTSTNSVFIDSSSFSTSTSVSGTPAQGSFTPYYPDKYWSGYFIPTTNLSIPSITIGTSNFTIETWAYLTVSDTNYKVICSLGNLQVRFGNSGFGLKLQVGVDISYLAGVWSCNVLQASVLNKWTHISFTRSGGVCRLFVNGVLQNINSGTDPSTYPFTSFTDPTVDIPANNFTVGDGGATASFVGNISNMRLLIGTALYTASFTVPIAPLSAIANTQLLILQDNRFKDNSTSSKILSITGAPSLEAFTPFAVPKSYTPAAYGGSVYFNGSTDYLQFPAGPAFAPGTGDFTLEGWVYVITHNTTQGNFFWMQSVAGTNYFYFSFFSTGANFTGISSGVGPYINGPAININTNAWYHLAVTRASGTVRVFINGVSGTPGTNTTDFSNTSWTPTLGSYTHLSWGLWNGYMSSVRYVKGVAVYTGDFTPPVLAPLKTSGSASASCYPSTNNVNTSFASTNTSLLLNFANAGVYDGTTKNHLSLIADTKTTATVTKFYSRSIAFDGSGDYFYAPPKPFYTLAVNDFTIDTWVYFSSLSGTQPIAQSDAVGSSTNNKWYLSYASGSLVFGTHSTGGFTVSGTWTPVVNTWYFVSVMRKSGTIYMFVDGSLITTTVTGTPANYSLSSNGITVGAINTPFYLTGNILDFRITAGSARYSTATSFIPPVGLLPNKYGPAEKSAQSNVIDQLPAVTADGGTVTTVGTYTFHTYTYTESGLFTITSINSTLDVLVVGGGGGGGANLGGGGAAGTYQLFSGLIISTGTYVVTVGAPGVGAYTSGTTLIPATNGGFSRFGTFNPSLGGGGGGSRTTSISSPGFSGGNGGGGAGGDLTPISGGSGSISGFAGGSGSSFPRGLQTSGGGGGGGSAAAGDSDQAIQGGTGGAGIANKFSGVILGQLAGGLYYLAGGGGGAGQTDQFGGSGGLGGGGAGGGGGNQSVGGDALPGTGSGGGGGAAGAAGGSGAGGVVIIQYTNVGISATATNTSTSTTVVIPPLPPVPAITSATGGTKVILGDYNVHIFNTPGIFPIVLNPGGNVEVLLVGGGGGGAGASYVQSAAAGGGGGGGGVVYTASLYLSAGTYNITVGAAGRGAHGTPDFQFPPGSYIPATNGSTSSIGTLLYASGGSAGIYGGGGTGGASGNATSGGTGYWGGSYFLTGGGGGGGAGIAGSNAGQNTVINRGFAGNGGNGLAYNTTGTLTYYGGGGGGGNVDNNFTPQSIAGSGGVGGGGAGGLGAAGSTATFYGGGGGGAGALGSAPAERQMLDGGGGFSGIAVVRYPNVLTSYRLFSSVSTINEGRSFTIVLITTGVGDGVLVPYQLYGVSSADISNRSLTGNFIIKNNTSSTAFTVTADRLTEGTEIFYMSVYTEIISVPIFDTSNASTSGTSTPTTGTQISSSTSIVSTGTATVSASLVAQGGTISTDSTYVYHTFSIEGTSIFTVTNNLYNLTMDVLMVGGGGSGGSGNDAAYANGGGGGGAVVEYFNITATTRTITVGTGGIGGIKASGTSNGGSTSISGLGSAAGGSGGGGSGTSDVGKGGTSGSGYSGGSGTHTAQGGSGSGNAGGGGGTSAVGGEGGNGSVIATGAIGQNEYTTPGTYTWTAPAGITSVSVVAVGAGGGGAWGKPGIYGGSGGGGGGGLGWKNNIPVIPGQTYTVVVGDGGTSYSLGGDGSTGNGYPGGASYFINSSTVSGLGGGGGISGTTGPAGIVGAAGGGFVGNGGGSGGPGGAHRFDGGGGAGGYSGNGGSGAYSQTFEPKAGQGGGGAGGQNALNQGGGGGGGGVGIYGQGANGTNTGGNTVGGLGGSGGEKGANAPNGSYGATNGGGGGAFGGGGGGGQGEAGVSGASGGATYNVTNSGAGAYVILGSNNPTITLSRGLTYYFVVAATGHPFWIKSVSSTGTGNAYSSGVTNNGTDNGTVVFAVPLDAPNTLYYNCQFHIAMAGTFVIDNLGGGGPGRLGGQGGRGAVRIIWGVDRSFPSTNTADQTPTSYTTIPSTGGGSGGVGKVSVITSQTYGGGGGGGTAISSVPGYAVGGSGGGGDGGRLTSTGGYDEAGKDATYYGGGGGGSGSSAGSASRYAGYGYRGIAVIRYLIAKTVTALGQTTTATYTLSSTSGPINEGQSYTVFLSTTGVSDGTSVPYTITGLYTTSADFGGQSLTGNFVVNNNAAQLTLNIAADNLTEGTENFSISVYDAKLTISILDTSNVFTGGSTTYTVTNSGSGAYVINGTNNPTINLIRGITYNFNINATGHPFWIKSVSSIGTGNAYSSGVTNNGTDNGTVVFAVPSDAPNTLYYNCQLHLAMAGQFNISTATTSTQTGTVISSSTAVVTFTSSTTSTSMTAQGGTISTDSNYVYHTFDSVGTSTFTVTSNPYNLPMDVLIVGGGGSGASTNDFSWSGGGGGGGAVYEFFNATATTRTVVVGGGGSGGNRTGGGAGGGSSSVSGIGTAGAGAGAPGSSYSDYGYGGTGGSGNGGGVGGNGNSSRNAGGGGGAGGAGGGGGNSTQGGGSGGVGVVSTITGQTYGGGGAGGTSYPQNSYASGGSGGGGSGGGGGTGANPAGGDATYYGGGGGGVGRGASASRYTGAGYQGIVIIRYTRGGVIYTPIATTATYTLTAASQSVNEGQPYAVVLSTTGVSDGTGVPYAITGAGITSADFGGQSLTGNFTVINNTAQLILNIDADNLKEGTENFSISVYSAKLTISILDTSRPAPITAGTLISTYCSGFDKYGTYADGADGTYNRLIATNSPDCGYTGPVTPYGTLLATYCSGYTKYGTYADGSGGSYNQIIANNSTDCGYVPPPEAGTLLSTYCSGVDKYGTYADGSNGTYDSLIQANSTDCGYVSPTISGSVSLIGAGGRGGDGTRGGGGGGGGLTYVPYFIFEKNVSYSYRIGSVSGATRSTYFGGLTAGGGGDGSSGTAGSTDGAFGGSGGSSAGGADGGGGGDRGGGGGGGGGLNGLGGSGATGVGAAGGGGGGGNYDPITGNYVGNGGGGGANSGLRGAGSGGGGNGGTAGGNGGNGSGYGNGGGGGGGGVTTNGGAGSGGAVFINLNEPSRYRLYNASGTFVSESYGSFFAFTSFEGALVLLP